MWFSDAWSEFTTQYFAWLMHDPFKLKYWNASHIRNEMGWSIKWSKIQMCMRLLPVLKIQSEKERQTYKYTRTRTRIHYIVHTHTHCAQRTKEISCGAPSVHSKYDMTISRFIEDENFSFLKCNWERACVLFYIYVTKCLYSTCLTSAEYMASFTSVFFIFLFLLVSYLYCVHFSPFLRFWGFFFGFLSTYTTNFLSLNEIFKMCLILVFFPLFLCVRTYTHCVSADVRATTSFQHSSLPMVIFSLEFPFLVGAVLTGWHKSNSFMYSCQWLLLKSTCATCRLCFPCCSSFTSLFKQISAIRLFHFVLVSVCNISILSNSMLCIKWNKYYIISPI